MIRALFSFMVLLCFFKTEGYQLVGGELQFVRLESGRYRVNLIHYYDTSVNDNGDDGPDPFAFVHIFRNRDGQDMSNQILFPADSSALQDVLLTCSNENLGTTIVLYSNIVNLEPTLYDDPMGYYLSWERCCRNINLTNIENPDRTGINYVLEIPPLLVNDVDFSNSSPIFTPIPSDYACLNQPFVADYSAIDPDGDSLVYSLTTPYSTTRTRPGIFSPQPKPHIEVQFTQGYSASSPFSTASTPVLSSKGLFAFTPTSEGLFAYAVKVEEYRNGRKIGEVRRECQLFIDADCINPDDSLKPILDVGTPSGFDPESDTLVLQAGQENCIDLLVSNLSPDDKMRFIIDNHDLDINIDEILSFRDTIVNSEELKVDLCIPDCFLPEKEYFSLEVLAEKRLCPISLYDTLRIIIKPSSEPNSSPVLSTRELAIARNNRDSIAYSKLLIATDPDNDLMDIAMVVEEVNDPFEFGFDLTTLRSEDGYLEAEFSWDTDCKLYNFDSVNQFNVFILVNDIDRCDQPGDTIRISARYEDVPNQKPRIVKVSELPSEVKIGETIEFQLSAEDNDSDGVEMLFSPELFDPTELDISFEKVSDSDLYTFSWQVPCENSSITEGAEFELVFLVQDFDRCGDSNFDTLRHTITILYPDLNQWRGQFSPPNAFSPNGDGKNDIFRLSGNPEVPQNLPVDICGNFFEEIVIFNRSGQQIFQSDSRDFVWNGAGYSNGTYFYLVRYTNEQFKGTLQLIR